jgi:hypothetical protein
MDEKNTIERLKTIINMIGRKKELSQEQINTIVSLVTEIHSGGPITDDYLIQIFANIGGV